MKYSMLTSALALATATGTPAQAQDAVTTASAQPAAEPSGGIAEIIVTAQKRDENVQDVPIAISVFTFIRGWEEYIFVFTFLVRNTNWTMSLYMYWVRDDVMGVDYGVVSAVGVFYLVPSLILYMAAQRYLMQMSIGGVKG